MVVGGGYGGMSLAVGLKRYRANYMLVDSRDAFHHNVAAVRAVVEPGFAKKTMIPYKETFGDNFTQGMVSEINPQSKTVQLKSGQQLPYDILVISLGSSVPFPGKVGHVNQKEGCQQYEDLVNRIKNSQHIAIVGGGPVGVEVATEIATDYPDKQVTIIHSRGQLAAPGLCDAFQKRLDEVLTQMKITTIYNEKVVNLNEVGDMGSQTLRTDKGRSLVADLVLRCIGMKINSDSYRRYFASSMEPNGQLRVDRHLLVHGHDDVFAIGDCNNIPEVKLAYLARQQANCTLENIHRKLGGQDLKDYKLNDQPFGLMMSLGRLNGIAENKNGQLMSDFMVKKIKSGPMFVGRYWSDMGQKCPK